MWNCVHMHMNCFLFLGVMNSNAAVCLCCARATAWQEVNSSGLKVMRSPEWRAVSSFSLVMFAELVISTLITQLLCTENWNFLTGMRSTELWRRWWWAARLERIHWVVKTTESLKWRAIYPVNWLRSNSWADSSGEETLVTFLSALNHTKFAAGQEVWPALTVPAAKDNTELHPVLKTKNYQSCTKRLQYLLMCGDCVLVWAAKGEANLKSKVSPPGSLNAQSRFYMSLPWCTIFWNIWSTKATVLSMVPEENS